jgi:HPt (histidine-containing phosphotransfer) domain-containing protein
MTRPCGGRDAIDVDVLLKRVRGNTALLKRLAALFVESAPGMRARVREAAARRDAVALREAVHALRGSVGILAGGMLGDVAVRVEELARTDRLAEAEEACATLDAELERFTVALMRIV